jgi:Protein of unknown function (DUF1579)
MLTDGYFSMIKIPLKQAIGAAALLLSASGSLAQPASNLPKIAARSMPVAEHSSLEPLVGTWHVEKSIFVALGSASNPARSSDMTTVREWVAGKHFLQDTTKGTVGGAPYERIGFLGYNPMDKRYEWTTIDSVTTITMSYVGANGSGGRRPIAMSGIFTDVGVTGEVNVGRRVAMRTVVTIADPDHHRFEIFFKPPGRPEVLADRMDFTRVK